MQGPFTIWDWERYRNIEGYCTGQDDVSMTLDMIGSWEAYDWWRWVNIARSGVVYDFGAHIGWFAIPPARAGAQVVCVEADPANVELLNINLRNRRAEAIVWNEWVENIDHLERQSITGVKADVEGAEDHVLRLIRPYLQRHQIQYALIECSPEFDDYYPDLIDEIRSYGYVADTEGVTITGSELGPVQKNVWFS